MSTDYDWEVLEIVNTEDYRGAWVKYTPAAEGCTECEIFVNVPWHKCTDQDHAKEIMQAKIRQRAPTRQWEKEIRPAQPDNSEAITNALNRDKHTGKEKPERERENQPPRRGDVAGVSESGGSQGQ